MDSAMEMSVSNQQGEIHSSRFQVKKTDTPYICATCGKAFLYHSHLKQHENVHIGDKLFMCDICGKTFGRRSDLKRHQLLHTSDVEMKYSFKCEECERVFTRKDQFKEHLRIRENLQLSCEECNMKFCTKFDLKEHMRTHSSNISITKVKRKMSLPTTIKSKRSRQQFRARDLFKTLMFYPNESEGHDLDVFYSRLHPELKESLHNEMRTFNAVKWYMVMKLSLERRNSEDIEVIQTYFHSKAVIQLSEDSITESIDEGYAKVKKSFEEFLQRGSGWILRRIHYLELKIAKYHPLAASSYIALPPQLAAKKAVLNIKNTDEKCLVWCLLAYKLNIKRHGNANQVSKYTPYESEIKLGDIQCPVPLQKISVIEKLNNLRINVFGYENEEVCPLYISPQEDIEAINLLLIADDKKQHYCLIRNFSRLMGDLTKHDGKSFYCFRCLHRFTNEALLKNHSEYCRNHTAQVIKMPPIGDNILRFTGFHLQHPVAYTIYADFESILIPISSSTPSSQNSYTEKIASHKPCGFAYVIVGPDGKSEKPIVVYRGEDAVENFLDKMMEEKEIISEKLLKIKPLSLTAEEEKTFNEATHCKVCDKPLGDDRRRDHCHLTGVYRGALHNNCNLNYRLGKTIPVIFHNLKHYDGHHLMLKLGKYTDHEIKVIATTMENYISFQIKKNESPIEMVFLDSFQFLPTSLEKLVQNLDPSQFNILEENFEDGTPLHLLTRKGVYPYDYFTSYKKFDETKLPPSTAFYNTLTEEHITEDDYEHAKNIWTTFKMKNLGEYHNLYVKTDVLLLADVFENFRKLCLNFYNLDPAHRFTSPGLAWQACLKMSDIQLELLTDINMLLLIEKGIRGGVSMISKRYAKANNPYMKNYDSKIPNSYILYLDANNLYGLAMSQPLPFGGFEWMSVEKVTEEWILRLQDNASEGYIFEVDLEYPHHLHPLHNDYPVAPEKITVSEEMLSPFAKRLCRNKQYVGTSKLIPNLNNKRNYVVHYQNLKFYLQLGLRITAVHKAIKFKQAPWLKKYIMFNTEKRKEAVTSFEKDFFKLLNNSVYGKTMENLRKRRDIVLCNTVRRTEKLIASPTFEAFKEFNEDLVAVERVKTSLLMNRPLYVGFTVLELSKLHMYKFHYNHIKKQYQQNATLLFTDTDSLCYHIQTKNIFHDMQQDANLFDFSDYPKNNPLYSEDNKKVIGKFKDELNSEIALEFVGLKSKMYSLKTSTSEKKRAKGVTTHIVRRKIKHEDYLECLQQLKTFSERQIRIGQDAHNLYTLAQNKISLSPFDDKRYLWDDGISSYAYGHCKILEGEDK